MKVCATVDMDNYREYRSLIDPDGADPDVSFYDSAVPRFLDAFDRHGIRATFFVIGRDLDRESHRRAVRQIHERGHEVANHSWSHPYNLRSLSHSEKVDEVGMADRAIADVVGERPVGFRCPSGEFDSAVLEVLDEHGYLYDSTIFPTPVMWAFMLYGKLFVRHGSYQLGGLDVAFAPRRTYRPRIGSAYRPHRQDADGHRVCEIPISTVPWLGLPFYGTLCRLLGPRVFDVLTRFHASRRSELNLILHQIDLVDHVGTPLEAAIARSPGLGVPFERRTRFIEGALASLARVGESVPLRDVARAYHASQPRLVEADGPRAALG